MNTNTIIRAWKTPSFRAALGAKQAPGHPAGARSLDAASLAQSADPERTGTMLTNMSTKTLYCCDPTSLHSSGCG